MAFRFENMIFRILLVLASLGAWSLDEVAAQGSDTFNYDKTVGNNYGPKDWGEVSCANKDTCPGWPTNYESMSPWIRYSANTCKDCSRSTSGQCFEHRQSPIALLKNVTKVKECIDIHKMYFKKGSCTFDQLKFHILPHVIRVVWPQNCTVAPQVDFSRGSPDPWNMRFMDFTIPSQHTIDGKHYPAEITLSHTYSVEKSSKRRFIGNLSILVHVGTAVHHNAFLERFLKRFERKANNIRQACDSRRKLTSSSDAATLWLATSEYNTSEPVGKQQQPLWTSEHGVDSLVSDGNSTGIIERRLNGGFHPYVLYDQTGTHYYFRYRGSWVEPPCLEDMTAEWRIMKDPIKVSPSQFNRLECLFLRRLNPETCVRESAGKPRPGKTSKKNFNRPMQTTTAKHGLMYCECVDFDPQTAKDKAYCAKSMEERGVSPYGG